MNMRSYSFGNTPKIFKILSEENRLRLINIFSQKSECVCNLVKETGLSQSLISHHIADLKSVGLVEGKEVGNRTFYSLTEKGKKIVRFLKEAKL
ncbi:MAG: hypothetical protein KatS3mg088_329 [Patescibacteria group bacterium]|nr:MAG: hypothetical protein KatS3mg088_329 [Patescibacteria group bacterium]